MGSNQSEKSYFELEIEQGFKDCEKREIQINKRIKRRILSIKIAKFILAIMLITGLILVLYIFK